VAGGLSAPGCARGGSAGTYTVAGDRPSCRPAPIPHCGWAPAATDPGRHRMCARRETPLSRNHTTARIAQTTRSKIRSSCWKPPIATSTVAAIETASQSRKRPRKGDGRRLPRAERRKPEIVSPAAMKTKTRTAHQGRNEIRCQAASRPRPAAARHHGRRCAARRRGRWAVEPDAVARALAEDPAQAGAHSRTGTSHASSPLRVSTH
jgi:hypothetical protein